MDASEIYIKMRLAAIPDLGMGTPPEFISNTEITWMTPLVCVDRLGNVYYFNKEQHCQLERQDQLQEMIDKYPMPAFGKLLNEIFDLPLWDWVRRKSKANYQQFSSMEQLWLAFVMKERYGKVLDGGKWIKTP